MGYFGLEDLHLGFRYLRVNYNLSATVDQEGRSGDTSHSEADASAEDDGPHRVARANLLGRRLTDDADGGDRGSLITRFGAERMGLGGKFDGTSILIGGDGGDKMDASTWSGLLNGAIQRSLGAGGLLGDLAFDVDGVDAINLLLRVGEEREGVTGTSRVQILLDGVEEIGAKIGDVGVTTDQLFIDEVETFAIKDERIEAALLATFSVLNLVTLDGRVAEISVGDTEAKVLLVVGGDNQISTDVDGITRIKSVIIVDGVLAEDEVGLGVENAELQGADIEAGLRLDFLQLLLDCDGDSHGVRVVDCLPAKVVGVVIGVSPRGVDIGGIMPFLDTQLRRSRTTAWVRSLGDQEAVGKDGGSLQSFETSVLGFDDQLQLTIGHELGASDEDTEVLFGGGAHQGADTLLEAKLERIDMAEFGVSPLFLGEIDGYEDVDINITAVHEHIIFGGECHGITGTNTTVFTVGEVVERVGRVVDDTVAVVLVLHHPGRAGLVSWVRAIDGVGIGGGGGRIPHLAEGELRGGRERVTVATGAVRVADVVELGIEIVEIDEIGGIVTEIGGIDIEGETLQ